MKQHYDVIIVGAGPAGAASATALARAGARVLCLEGRRARAKPCGGCLSRWALNEMAWLGPPAWLEDHPVHRLRLAAPGRPDGVFATQAPAAYFVDRAMLDGLLARRATEAGASVVAASARGVHRQGPGFVVETDLGDWRSDWLVGADGAASRAARCLGMGGSVFIYRAVVEERPAGSRLMERLAGTALLELGATRAGYGWAFLRGGVLNLGLAGCGVGGKRLQQDYTAFLRRHGLGEPGPWRGAAIPCPDGRRRVLARGRALLAGDAGGLADPFLGEGIGPALLSGRLAAEAIMRGSAEGYVSALAQGLLADARAGRRLARLVYSLPGWFQHMTRKHPGGIELGWRILKGELRYADIWSELARRLNIPIGWP